MCLLGAHRFAVNKHPPTGPRLVSFKELLAELPIAERTLRRILAELPIAERTLRRILAELGYRRAPGRGRLVFNPQQVAAIKAALSAQTPPIPAAEARTPTPSTTSRAAFQRSTRMWLRDLRRAAKDESKRPFLLDLAKR